MKLKPAHYSSILFSILLSGLGSAKIEAGTMGEAQVIANETIYFGIFGGGGSSNQVSINQYGTAFYTEAAGGPLAVNALGHTSSRNLSLVGAHIGYQWKEVFLSSFANHLSLSPAVELEGYHARKSSFTGHDISSDASRLPEHDFLVTYPMSTNVFLANTVLSINLAHYSRWHPYAGAGIGAAVVSISDANSAQTLPPEVGVNHYNGNPNDRVSTFAAQAKAGLSFDFNDYLSIFAEYRWLYLCNTSFTFGSTVYPAHVTTSSWNANLGPQHYNIGAGGIRFTI